MVGEPVRRGIDVALHGGDGAVAVLIDARDFGGISIEQALLKETCGSNEARRK
jgi:hypothetical protein